MFKYNSKQIDQWGIIVSLLCAVHCALLPILISLIPLWGLSFLRNSYFELTIICSSAILATLSLYFSYQKHHQKLPIILVILGFTMIGIGHFFVTESAEWIFLTTGGITVASAHFYNWRLDQSCKMIKFP